MSIKIDPEDFVKIGPKTVQDLIGKASQVAKVFIGRVNHGDKRPIKLLCYGDPGVGKTATCSVISNAIAKPFMVRRISAASLTAETMSDWLHDLKYKHEDWRVYWVEEVDAVNPTVELLLLQFLDDMPEKTAALFTSNESMSGITDRFQSRTHAVRFPRPSQKDVEKFLLSRWEELGEEAKVIADLNNGDVRASLNDAQMFLDVRRFG